MGNLAQRRQFQAQARLWKVKFLQWHHRVVNHLLASEDASQQISPLQSQHSAILKAGHHFLLWGYVLRILGSSLRLRLVYEWYTSGISYISGTADTLLAEVFQVGSLVSLFEKKKNPHLELWRDATSQCLTVLS